MSQLSFADYINAGFPAVMLVTHEYERAELAVRAGGKWQSYSWDCLRGIRETGKREVIEEILNPVDAINWIKGKRDTLLICHNLHLFLNNPELIQAIQIAVLHYKSFGNCLIALSPAVTLRPELEKLFVVVDLPLPSESELVDLQAELGSAHKTKINKKAARSAKGLTEFEAEGAYALSLSQKRYFSSRTISSVKEQLIRKSGLLECYPPCSIRELGGLAPLKEYITLRAQAFHPSSTLPRLKSMLLVGIPGCGKSLVCKTVSSILNWPLVRLDIGSLKNSLVGESEKRMREATKVIEAIGEAVVWLDELEKQFAGIHSSGHTDGGTTSGMFSHWLTWMQETSAPVLIMATANDVSGMPPEFLRAGRFDKLWFVDLPTLSERRDILKIMNRRFGAEIPLHYAEKLAGYSGSEIEAVVKDSLFTDFDTALREVVPLSRLMREKIESIRKWASGRAQCANTPELPSETFRHIRKKFPTQELIQ